MTTQPFARAFTYSARRSVGAAIALACAAGVLASSARAQTWEYKSFKRDRATKQYSKDNFVAGTISVEEKNGEHFFRMTAGELDVCYRGALPVTVERGAGTIVITARQPVPGCEDFRYRIREDGSGGIKEVRQSDGEWRRSPFNHGLHAVK